MTKHHNTTQGDMHSLPHFAERVSSTISPWPLLKESVGSWRCISSKLHGFSPRFATLDTFVWCLEDTPSIKRSVLHRWEHMYSHKTTHEGVCVFSCRSQGGYTQRLDQNWPFNTFLGKTLKPLAWWQGNFKRKYKQSQSRNTGIDS